jgi:hypothetical protein
VFPGGRDEDLAADVLVVAALDVEGGVPDDLPGTRAILEMTIVWVAIRFEDKPPVATLFKNVRRRVGLRAPRTSACARMSMRRMALRSR